MPDDERLVNAIETLELIKISLVQQSDRIPIDDELHQPLLWHDNGSPRRESTHSALGITA